MPGNMFNSRALAKAVVDRKRKPRDLAGNDQTGVYPPYRKNNNVGGALARGTGGSLPRKGPRDLEGNDQRGIYPPDRKSNLVGGGLRRGKRPM
jgi:hypothetical protein